MNHNQLFSVAACILVLGAGCVNEPEIIDTRDTSTDRVRSMDKVSSTDFIEAAEYGINSILSDEIFSEYLAEYKTAGHGSSRPLLMISAVQNRTTAHVDMPLLTSRISSALLKSRKVRVTSVLAADTAQRDTASKELRNLEDDEDFDQQSVLQRGTLKSPDLTLSGAIIEQRNTSGRMTELTYFFDMRLTNARTGEVVWEDHIEIGRRQKRPLLGF